MRYRAYLHIGKNKACDALVSCPTFERALNGIIPYALTMADGEDIKIIVRKVKDDKYE